MKSYQNQLQQLNSFLTAGHWVYNDKCFREAAAQLKAVKLELILSHSASSSIMRAFADVETAFMGMFEMLLDGDFDTLSDQQDDTYKYLCYLESIINPVPAEVGQPF